MATTIAVDVAKSVFEVAVSDHPGRITERRRLSRAQFVQFIATRRPATILMEACGTAHFWGRQALACGHHVVLLPPHAVRPYVPRNKTDRTDTKGLLEAGRNDAIHPVPVNVSNAGSVTTEGDRAARADMVRALGYDGRGVVVGVISDGIDDLARSQASGDLPAVNVPSDPRCRRGSGDEGTAMLEIVHDLAPGATLMFSEGLSSSQQLINSIACLATAGAKVIVDDIASPTQPYFEDGAVALAAAQAVAKGISYHTAAGNFADGEYLVTDYRAGAQGFHDFDPSGTADLFDTLILPPGGLLTCHLQWNEPFGFASSDYDLIVIDSVTGMPVAISDNFQPFYPDPQEDLAFRNVFSLPFLLGVGIQKLSGTDRTLKLLCTGMVPPGLEWRESALGSLDKPHGRK